MNVKEQLERVIWNHQQIVAKLIQLDRLMELRRTLDKFVFNPKDPAEAEEFKIVGTTEALDSVQELIAMLHVGIMELVNKYWEVKDLIGNLEDPRQQLVMELRYLCGKEWGQIVFIMGCSFDEVKQLHDKALVQLEEISKKKKKQ